MEPDVEERFARIEKSLEAAAGNLATLSESMLRYAEGSDARMTRLEENLELLIRAITTEHTNGRGSKKGMQ
jgi:hypothetical protein